MEWAGGPWGTSGSEAGAWLLDGLTLGHAVKCLEPPSVGPMKRGGRSSPHAGPGTGVAITLAATDRAGPQVGMDHEPGSPETGTSGCKMDFIQ